MKTGLRIHLSVIVPAYNEEHRIGSTLRSIIAYLQNQNYRSEILVVDDGSRDDTCSTVLKYTETCPFLRIIYNEGNRGKGYSVKHGLQEARGDVILFTDADNSTSIEMIERFWKYFEGGCSVVIGSRKLPDSNIISYQMLFRRFAGFVFNLIRKILFGWSIKDSQCGFKAFSRDCARDIVKYQHLHRFAFDVELLVIARRRRWKIQEVPIVWNNDEDSRVSFLNDSTRMFFDMLKIFSNTLAGKYPRRRPS